MSRGTNSLHTQIGYCSLRSWWYDLIGGAVAALLISDLIN